MKELEKYEHKNRVRRIVEIIMPNIRCGFVPIGCCNGIVTQLRDTGLTR